MTYNMDMLHPKNLKAIDYWFFILFLLVLILMLIFSTRECQREIYKDETTKERECYPNYEAYPMLDSVGQFILVFSVILIIVAIFYRIYEIIPMPIVIIICIYLLAFIIPRFYLWFYNPIVLNGEIKKIMYIPKSTDGNIVISVIHVILFIMSYISIAKSRNLSNVQQMLI